MARIKVRYLVAKPGRDGAVRWFWQPAKALRAAGWHAERLPDVPADAIAAAERRNAELDAWRAGRPLPHATTGKLAKRPARGTLDDVIARYKGSRFYKDRKPATRRAYDYFLEKLSRWAGDAPIRAITAKRVDKLYTELAAVTPALARQVVTMGSTLCDRSRKLYEPGEPGHMAVDPFERMDMAGSPRSGVLWPRAAVAAFVAAADAAGRHSIGTAVALNEWLGQRQADVLRIRRSGATAGRIVQRQNKTGAGVVLPVAAVPALARRIEAELAWQAARFGKDVAATTLIVNEMTGQPFTADSFRMAFGEVRAALARTTPTFAADYLVAGQGDDGTPTLPAEALKFMHLRHTAVTRLYEAGCSIEQIATITGHTLKSVETIIERYLVRTSKVAEAAFRQRLDHEREQQG
jgi:integrase